MSNESHKSQYQDQQHSKIQRRFFEEAVELRYATIADMDKEIAFRDNKNDFLTDLVRFPKENIVQENEKTNRT